MRRCTMVWALAAGLLASMWLEAGCKNTRSVTSGLVRKKQRAEGTGGADVLSRLGQPATRAGAARELGEKRVKTAAAALKGYLEDRDPLVRLNCVWALGEMGDRTAIVELRTRLTDRDERVRAAAADALAKMPDEKAILWLGQATVQDTADEVRLAAVKALGKISEAKSAEWLVKAMFDRSPAVPPAAAEGLRKVGPPAIEPIRASLGKLSGGGLLLVARALAGMDEPATAEALVETLALSAPGPGGGDSPAKAQTRQVAIEALAAIGEPAIGPLVSEAVEKPGNLPLKAEAAKVMKRVGKASIAPLARRILPWTRFPDRGELEIWIGVLEAVGAGEPRAQEALSKARDLLAGAGTQAVATTTVPAAGPPADDGQVVGPLMSPASSGGFAGGLKVVLHKALLRGEAAPAHLVLDVEAADSHWLRAWGMALGYSNGIHIGVVDSGAVAGETIRLKVSLKIAGDLWVPPGGRASYDIELKRAAGGGLAGTFRGDHAGRQVAGTAAGEIQPPRPLRVEGFQPVRQNEHPRVLLRKADVPRYRRKLKTPLGQAYYNQAVKAWDPINLGLLYQLTGDAQYANEARKVIEGYQGDITQDGFGSGGFGHRFVSVCLAYDLCFDVWPEAFRKPLEEQFLEYIPKQQIYLMTNHPNFHPCSNYYGPGRGVPAIGALVLMGRKGPLPAQPLDPVARATVLEPAADYKPPAGTPVVELSLGKMPDKWLYAGPIAFQAEQDVLEGIGGYASARPTEGTTARFAALVDGMPQSMSVTFKPLPEALLGGGAGVDVARLGGSAGGSTTILFTVVKVAAEQTVGLIRPSADTKVWLAGVPLDARAFYRLKAGLYPMLVVHATDKPAGAIGPRLAEPADEHFADRRALYDLELALWKADQEAWRANGGADPSILQLAEVGRQQVAWHYRLGIGDGGFQAETGGYANISSWYPTVYATAYQKVFGRDASAYPDVTYLMPRKIMQTLFVLEGKPIVQKINSAAGVDARWCAAAMPIVPDKYQPVVLWAWNRVAGVTGESTIANTLGREGGLDLAHSFLHYPLDMKPVDPREAMPLTWEAKTFGFHCFRSGWQGGDEFIGQAFLKARPVVGWNHPNAGTFRLFGLGHPWVVGATERAGFRPQEPVVLLPADAIDESACGHLAYLQTQADGSGNLTIDLNDVYAPHARKGAGSLYDRNLIRWPENATASAITGLRAIAFDYSGHCGAPAMLVLVDRIEGGGKRQWLWQLPAGAKERVKVADGGFTLDWSDASMKVTFIEPAGVRPEVTTDEVALGDTSGHHSFKGKLDRVKVTGEGSFFVVATIQRNAAPEVKVEGKGLAAKVTVGRQTVRFDPAPPGKIVLEPAP